MGLDYAKSLLPVRRHKAKPMRFLDIILGQVVTARKRLGVALPLTLMDSFRTSRDTMAAVAKDRPSKSSSMWSRRSTWPPANQ